jgi:hypothetical protein
VSARTFDGRPLEPGVNVDKVNIARGMKVARDLGYCTTPNESMVVEYALQRWQRGEEDGAEASWMSEFGKSSYGDFRVVLAAAVSHG